MEAEVEAEAKVEAEVEVEVEAEVEAEVEVEVEAEVKAEVEAEGEVEQEEADEEEAEKEASEEEEQEAQKEEEQEEEEAQEEEEEEEAEEAPSLAARLGTRLPTAAPSDTSPPIDHLPTGPLPTSAATEEATAAAEVAAKAAAKAVAAPATAPAVVVTRPPMPSTDQIEAMDTMVELRAALEAQGESGVARSKQVLRGRLLSLAAVRDTVRRQNEELRQEERTLGIDEEALRQAELHPFTADAQYDRSEILARVDPLKPRANGAAPPRQDAAAAAAAAAAAGKPARGRRRLASTATWEEAACDGRAELAVVLHAVPSGSPAGVGRGPKPRLPAGRAFHDALRNRNCK